MNIGDYVRTKNGKIIKVGEEELYDINLDSIKSSPNIIDLIEVGDYVNGEKVIYVGYSMYEETKNGLKGIGDKIVMVGIYNNWGFDKKTLKERDIKSILTKEQFESMKYEVEYEKHI